MAQIEESWMVTRESISNASTNWERGRRSCERCSQSIKGLAEQSKAKGIHMHESVFIEVSPYPTQGEGTGVRDWTSHQVRMRGGRII